MRNVIPMIFLNLRNYDPHHIMEGLEKIKNHEYEVIASNMEKYIALSLSNRNGKYKISLCFIDSFQFMPTSIDI